MVDETPPGAGDPVEFLRSEARFALNAGAILLVLGFLASCSLAALALDHGQAPWSAIVYGGPPLLVGWAAWGYAALRLDQARRLETGETDETGPPWRRRVQALTRRAGFEAKRLADFFRR